MISLQFQVWSLAIGLAKEHVEKRLPEVVSTVAGRLVEMERCEAAGELYEDINAIKEVSIHASTSLLLNVQISIRVSIVVAEKSRRFLSMPAVSSYDTPVH